MSETSRPWAAKGAAARNMETVNTVRDLRAVVAGWRGAGQTVALVPTMGALHEGHLSLIRTARTLAEQVIVTIFVNPTQFGPTEDFSAYPRTLEEDRFKVAMAGAHLVYAPTVAEMYPQGFATTITVEGVTEGLCGESRPGHFQGVATVVCKLLLQALPDVAVFGEKDFQQLQVIRRMATDLDVPVRIEGAPTVREMDGLAMSSRNTYLNPQERSVANYLYKSLYAAGQEIRGGMAVDVACARAVEAIRAHGFGKIDYLELRDVETLQPLPVLDRPARLFAAAFLGKTRLIDNVPVEPGV